MIMSTSMLKMMMMGMVMVLMMLNMMVMVLMMGMVFKRFEHLPGFTAQDGVTHFKTHMAPKCKKATSCVRTSQHSEVSPHKTVSPTTPCVGREPSAFIAVGSLLQLETARSQGG